MSSHHAIDVDAKDLPLHCPRPGDTLWNAHPRVFLPLETKGEARCPYCGALYRLQGWEPGQRHGH